MVLLSEDRRNKSCPPADFIALAKAGQVVNRPITTGTRMGDPRDVWTGRWYTHTHSVNVQGPMKGLTCFIARLIREYGGEREG